MAFSASGLTNMATGGGHNLWFYTSTDALTAVRVSGYFNDASTMMNVGDVVFVYDSDAPTMGISVVLSNASGVVDIADGTALTVSDTD
jgi:predicted RNA-binding protein with PUA-like domain